MAAMMQLHIATVALPATGITTIDTLSTSARVNSTGRLAMRRLVAVRAESNVPASGGTTVSIYFLNPVIINIYHCSWFLVEYSYGNEWVVVVLHAG
jgi:hypothetical protein